MHSVPETPLFFRARRIGDGQTFELFRRFYFRIFGGNLICPSLTLPARKTVALPARKTVVFPARKTVAFPAQKTVARPARKTVAFPA